MTTSGSVLEQYRTVPAFSFSGGRAWGEHGNLDTWRQECMVMSFLSSCTLGHMEKQETEMKQKLEMETGNGEWKWKLEMKIGNGNWK